MTDHRADQLAAILSQCDEFWMAGRSPQDRQPSTLPRDSDARDDSYHRLICDLIKQQIERDSSCAGDNPSRLEAYLHEHSDVPFSDGALLELIEYEFISRHRGGDWPDIDEYAEKFPHLESAVRTRLQNARDDVVTHASVCSVLQEGTATSPDDETREASPASLPAGADELAATLRQIRPFCDLSRHVREAVALHAVVRPFAAGDVLLRQGEAADALVILLEGTAEVWLNDAGQLVPIARLQRHTVVGELGLVTQEVRSATVSATSPGCAAIIDRQAFETLAGRYPRLSIALAELSAERVGTLAIDVLCGKTIDKYLIRRRLGRGATGIVYSATEAGSQRAVALKMLRHDLTYDRHAALRFQQEADIIGELQHPNIVAVLSEFTAYGTSFIAMEMCDGPSLADLIARHGRLPIRTVQAILGQLAAGLSSAHAARIAHRDLKPSNVLLTSDGTVKIVDFGLARHVTADEPGATAFGQIVGTPRYMSPEQLAGERGDARSDLFSLGCIAYEMLVGRTVFVAPRFNELLIERARWTLPAAGVIREDLPPALYQLLVHLLEYDPDVRYCDLLEVAEWAERVDRDLLAVP